MSSLAFTNCQVCNIVTSKRKRHRAYVCEPCRRFYLRHRDNSSKLTCETGRYDCLTDDKIKLMAADNSTIAIKPSGTIWRSICPACRLNKCFSLGMRSPSGPHGVAKCQQPESPPVSTVHQPSCENSEDQSSNNNTALVVFHHPNLPVYHQETSKDFTVAEDIVCNLVNSACRFMKGMEMVNLRAKDSPLCNFESAWREGIIHFHNIVEHLTIYVRSLPGFKDIDVRDRCALLVNAHAKVNTAESCYKPVPKELNMLTANYQRLCQVAPELAYVSWETKCIWSMMNEWQPSTVEFAFLLAFCFYNSNGIKLVNEVTVTNSLRQLQQTYTAYLSRQFGGDREMVVSRCERMARMLAIFQEASERRFDAYLLIVKRYRPEMDKLFSEIVSSNHKQRFGQIGEMTSYFGFQ